MGTSFGTVSLVFFVAATTTFSFHEVSAASSKKPATTKQDLNSTNAPIPVTKVITNVNATDAPTQASASKSKPSTVKDTTAASKTLAPTTPLKNGTTSLPTKQPTKQPTQMPTQQPTQMPTQQPTKPPTRQPTKANPTQSKAVTTQLPVSSTAAMTCEDRSGSCKACSEDIKCVWCKSTSSCSEYPLSKIVPRNCPKNDWYYKQCFVPGYVLIILIPVVVAILLITCCCCIYCKCCRRRSGGQTAWKATEERITQRRKDQALKKEEKKQERERKTEAMRMKYGLLRDDDDDEAPLI